MEETITSSVKIQVRKCDFCGDVIKSSYEASWCQFCHRDVCPKHRRAFDYEYLTPGSFSGDNPEALCLECWEIGKPFIEKIKKARLDLEKIENEQFDLWKEALKKLTRAGFRL